jgi:hypothetical protein
MHKEHGKQYARCTGCRAGQVERVHPSYTSCVQHKAEADEQPCQEEERQQSGIVAGNVPDLACPGCRVLQLQRVEWIDRNEVEPQRGGRHKDRREHGKQAVASADKNLAPERQYHPAKREAGHDDGYDPVAVFRPGRDGEIADQRGLVADRGKRDEEHRPKTHGQTWLRMKLATSALKRPASSMKSA